MATPDEMRALATMLEEIAPHVDTDYGPGQVATYGLAWEALRAGADEIERRRAFVAKVHDAVEGIDPDVLPPNGSAAMVAVQDALAEMSVIGRSDGGQKSG